MEVYREIYGSLRQLLCTKMELIYFMVLVVAEIYMGILGETDMFTSRRAYKKIV